MPFTHLWLPQSLLDAVIAQARSALPNECCGLLAGVIMNGTGRVTRQFAIRNDLASSTEYFTNPRDLLDAMKAMRAEGVEALAFYHSHPSSATVPSKTDIERNYWGESVMHLIVGDLYPTTPVDSIPAVRAWWIGEAGFREANWTVV
jgi:proteasome lid subunit RPN8/RPN11